MTHSALVSKTEESQFLTELRGEKQCTVAQPHCLSCYQNPFEGKEYCDTCDQDYLLDINAVPYKCVTCPEECADDCIQEIGCDSCNPGFFKTQITKTNPIFTTKRYICEKCSAECKECELFRDNCTECPEYYKLVDKKCKFAYFHLIFIGAGVILIVIITMILLIIKCVCMEDPPARPNFGTILDKDPDLQSDHIKYDMKTIGGGRQNESFISVVEPSGDDNYLNVSQYSQDPIITQLLGPANHNPQLRSEVGEMDRGNEPDDLNERIKNQRIKRNKTVFRG